MTAAVLTDRQRWLSLAAVMANIVGIGLAFGALVPLLGLILEEQKVSAAVIGLNASMFSVAVLIMGPFLPRLVGWLGTMRSLFIGLGISGTACLLFPVLPWLPAWFALRLMIGVGSSIGWLVTEIWMNTLATDRNRGMVMGVYATVLASGFAAGPAVISLTGTGGTLPFFLTAGAIALSAVPLVLARGIAPAMPERPHYDLLRMIRLAPLIIAAGLVGGFCDTALYAMLPIYVLRSGLSETTALLMLSFFTAGNLVLQLVLGWVADRTSRYAVLMFCAGATVTGAVLLPLLIDQPALLWPMLFLWGGTSFGVYAIGLGLLGQRFGGPDLLAANSAMIMGYVLGGITGPATAGAAMDLWHREGLVVVVGSAAGLFLLWGLLRGRPS